MMCCCRAPEACKVETSQCNLLSSDTLFKVPPSTTCVGFVYCASRDHWGADMMYCGFWLLTGFFGFGFFDVPFTRPPIRKTRYCWLPDLPGGYPRAEIANCFKKTKIIIDRERSHFDALLSNKKSLCPLWVENNFLIRDSSKCQQQQLQTTVIHFSDL